VTDLISIVAGKLIIHPLFVFVLLFFFTEMALLYQHVAIFYLHADVQYFRRYWYTISSWWALLFITVANDFDFLYHH
jgi:hypothetical protein